MLLSIIVSNLIEAAAPLCAPRRLFYVKCSASQRCISTLHRLWLIAVYPACRSSYQYQSNADLPQCRRVMKTHGRRELRYAPYYEGSVSQGLSARYCTLSAVGFGVLVFQAVSQLRLAMKRAGFCFDFRLDKITTTHLRNLDTRLEYPQILDTKVQ